MSTSSDAVRRTPLRPALVTATVAAAALCTAVGGAAVVDAGPASASVAASAGGTITYIAGYNVFVAQQDGSSPRQLTSDGTAGSSYYLPTQSDDGTVVAGRGDLIYRMDQWGHVFNTIDPPDLKSGGGQLLGGPPTGLAVSPDGTKIAYSYMKNYCSGGGYCLDWPVTGITASGGLTDPGVYGTTYGQHPSWVTNTRIVADHAREYGNVYLFELGRGTVGSADHWFDDTNLRASSHRKLTDPEIARSAPYATLVRGEYDQAEILLIDLRAAGNYATGNPARELTQVCNTWEELDMGTPILSPDGSVLAWESPYGVLASAVSGGGCADPDVLIPDGWSPSFSPATMQTTRPTYPPSATPTQPGPSGPAGPTTGATSGPSPSPTVDVTPSFTVRSAPKVAGSAKVGRKLKAGAVRFEPVPTTVKYQWLRDRKAIKGATKATYKVTRHDRRHRLSVRVTGFRAGYATAVAVSKPVRVKR